MRDRTAYIPGTMTLATPWTPRPPAGSSLEVYRAWCDLNCPDGEFNASLAELEVEEDRKRLPQAMIVDLWEALKDA
jgi:hypothetical protein